MYLLCDPHIKEKKKQETVIFPQFYKSGGRAEEITSAH